MRNATLRVVLGALLLWNSIALATTNDALLHSGQVQARVCIACHGNQGEGMAPPNIAARPRLSGLHPDYLIAQLQAYEEGRRQNPIMQAIAALLTPAQMQAVSHYFASLPTIALPTDTAPDAVLARGRQLVEVGDASRGITACIACHGPGAYGQGALFPNINGQPADYTATQLRAWQQGRRRSDPDGQMRQVAMTLSEADIQALAQWLAQQPPTPSQPAHQPTRPTAKGQR